MFSFCPNEFTRNLSRGSGSFIFLIQDSPGFSLCSVAISVEQKFILETISHWLVIHIFKSYKLITTTGRIPCSNLIYQSSLHGTQAHVVHSEYQLRTGICTPKQLQGPQTRARPWRTDSLLYVRWKGSHGRNNRTHPLHCTQYYPSGLWSFVIFSS